MDPRTLRERLRLSSRTIAISGLALCLLFFSPFVSCGAQTLTGAEAARASMPSQYNNQAADGIFLMLLPLVGLAAIVVGLNAMGRVEREENLGALRGLGTLSLAGAVVAAFPLAILLYDVNRAGGPIRLEWGFWGSVLATIALGAGAIGLRGAKAPQPVQSTVPPP
jgi:uncharacterized BrkB/YihY/UPF0761 family membrane protein